MGNIFTLKRQMKYWEGNEESLFPSASVEQIKKSIDGASFPRSFIAFFAA